jgi:hypothetical protein
MRHIYDMHFKSIYTCGDLYGPELLHAALEGLSEVTCMHIHMHEIIQFMDTYPPTSRTFSSCLYPYKLLVIR